MKIGRLCFGGLFAGAMLAALNGCTTSPINDGKPSPAALGAPPAYRELAEQHNTRLAEVVGFYTTANVEVTWVDEKGTRQREVGEGNLIFSRPDQVALTFRKLGEVYLWLGGGPERSWMFWGGEISRAFIARNENVLNTACEAFPIPLLPAELIDLYGVFAWPAEAVEGGLITVAGDEARQAWVVTTPGRWSRRRVWLNSKDWRPIRVELFDGATGRVWAASELSEYKEMEIRGVAPGRRPFMPTRVQVRAGESQVEGVVSLTLFNPADVPAGHTQIKPTLFDFEAIRRNMRPHEVVVLDKDCERPALDEPPDDTP